MTKDTISRRRFLQTTTMAALGGVLLDSRQAASQKAPWKSSTVVLVRDARVLEAGGQPRAEVVLDMLDRAVAELTGARDAAGAWKTLVEPADTVGIKSNVWNFLPTPRVLEEAIAKRVAEAGVDPARIAADDRGVLKNPVFQKATALINTRPARTHHWSGLGTLIKNYITFVPNPSAYHPDSCADLATLWQLPAVQGKTRLNVLVLLTPQFHGVGPHSYSPQHVWRYNGLAVGYDPVAVDAVGLRVIEAKRKEYFEDDRPLNPPAKHIQLADTRHHLGTADPAKIKLVVVGGREGLLIDAG
jgi:hypothetical protein